MTQEELDALIAGEPSPSKSGHDEKKLDQTDIVDQLGQVTSESEAKASQIFDHLEDVLSLLDKAEENPDQLKEALAEARNIIFETMSVMQYQDIHRQKIERVINTMRTITMVMNSTLNSVSTPQKSSNIAPSAKHLPGDEDADIVSEDELAALIASMGQK